MAKQAFEIRLAKAEDYDSITELMSADLDFHRKGLPGLYRETAAVNYTAEKFATLIAGPDSTVWVAERNGTIEGLAAVVSRDVPESAVALARRIAEIDYISVRGTTRRQGIGRALAEACVAWARTKNDESIVLNVFSFNEDAIDFYRATGFAPLYFRMSRPIKD